MNKRTKILKAYGAQDEDIKSLLEYNENTFKQQEKIKVPLESELFAKVWKEYVAEGGDFNVLRTKILQFNFPIEKGISENEDYLKSAEEGELVQKAKESKGLDLKHLSTEVISTPGGEMPVVILRERKEFEKVIQTFSHKNEPETVPASMGASTYAGYNNWERIERYKQQWQSIHGTSEVAWGEEFDRMIGKKELYKDSFIVLSDGPYSAVLAKEMDLPEDEWRALSLDIRKYHETAHYFTKRLLGTMRNNVLDEVFCDFVGLVIATGEFKLDWALKFLGLENFPQYRKGARLENYVSKNISEDGAQVLRKLIYDTLINVDQVYKNQDPYTFVYAMSYFSLEELATSKDELVKKLEEVEKRWIS